MGPLQVWRVTRAATVIVVGCALAGGAAAPAVAADTGPALSVDQGALAASLRCSAAFDTTRGEPLVLLPGTGATPKQNFDRSWTPALDAEGRRWCTVELPEAATGDVQTAAEFVTSAIRTVSARAGSPVALVGHSQGGMVGRWSLKFWPDTRAMVSDYVSLAGSNHGTVLADGLCSTTRSCTPANWQQASQSAFIRALNEGAETYAGIAYTSVYTRLDQVVQPNLDEANGSTSLRTGDGDRVNVALQDVCPTDAAEHLLIGSADNTAFRLALDAVDRDGPADPVAVRTELLPDCLTGVPGLKLIPGVTPATLLTISAEFAGNANAAEIPAEPALRCYVTASCPAGATPAPATAGTTTTTPSTGSAASSGAAGPTATPPAATTPGTAAAARLRPTLTAALVRRRDRSAPFTYVLRGRLVAPAGVSAARACAGTVAVRVAVQRGKTVSRRQVALRPDCSFASTVRVRSGKRLGRAGALRFGARFAGNAALLPASAPPVQGLAR